MKLIPKLQQGGWASYFETYKPVQVQSRGSSRETKAPKEDREDKESGELTKKDLFNMIKDINGLPNEMQNIVSDLMSTFQLAELTGSPLDIEHAYLRSLYDIKVAGQNKTRFDEILKTATTDGVLQEAAIAGNGELVIQKKDGSLGTISVAKYLENTDKYSVMTNSNIAWLRRNSPNFVNDSTAFDIISNGMSFKVFQELLDKAEKSLGTTEQSYKGAADMSTQDKALLGLQVLKSLSGSDISKYMNTISPSKLYEYDIVTKEQSDQIQALMSYMQKVMPQNAKSWASLKTGIKDSNAALMQLVSQYLISGTSPSRTVDLIPKDFSGSSSSSSSGADGSKIETNNASRFLDGLGYEQTFVINPGTSYSMVVRSNTVPLTANKKQLGPLCTLQEVSQGEFGGILDWNKATMGGRKLRIETLNQVMVEDGQIYSIDYPTDANGNPDFTPTTKSKYDKAVKQLQSMGIDLTNAQSIKNNYNTINKVMQDNQLSAIYDQNGTLISGRWGRFAVMNGVAFDKTLGIEIGGSGGALLQEEEDDMTIDNIIQHLESKFDGKYSVDKNDAWIFEGDYDALYRGTIWMPIKNDRFNALAGNDIKGPETYILDVKQQTAKIWNAYNQPPELQ